MDIIRAWKDEGYRNSLSAAERAALPPNPAGLITLTDEDLGAVAGGMINSTRSICEGGVGCTGYCASDWAHCETAADEMCRVYGY
jgi:mersacidin/lichenicidin family type 2 lantibiotic